MNAFGPLAMATLAVAALLAALAIRRPGDRAHLPAPRLGRASPRRSPRLGRASPRRSPRLGRASRSRSPRLRRHSSGLTAGGYPSSSGLTAGGHPSAAGLAVGHGGRTNVGAKLSGASLSGASLWSGPMGRTGARVGSRWDRAPGRLAAGGAALLAAAISAATPRLALVALSAPVAWLIATRVVRRRTAARRQALRAEAAPVLLDLLSAALLAGLNPHRAVLRIADRAPDVLRDELALAAAVLRLGGTPAAALRAAAEHSGLGELRAAAGAMEAAERWGAPPAEALAARADALRSRARLRAEANAGRAAVRLAFPLVLCFLPAFVLLTVVPTIAGSLRALAP